MSAQVTLSQAFTLPNGSVVKNRLLKSAMSEALGRRDGSPTPELARLYGAWADGGIGLCVTGNVMIDRRALGERAFANAHHADRHCAVTLVVRLPRPLFVELRGRATSDPRQKERASRKRAHHVHGPGFHPNDLRFHVAEATVANRNPGHQVVDGSDYVPSVVCSARSSTTALRLPVSLKTRV